MRQFLLTTILCLFMAISGFAQQSGQLTETMTWEFADSTLTISGTGAMPDYVPFLIKAPWVELRKSIKKVILSEGVINIGDCAFIECNLTSITIPEGVTSIGSYAFFGCESLTSITIPDGVTSIGGSAFYSCKSLTSIDIPNGVVSIENAIFESCTGLTSISIPNSVTSIGEMAFYRCSGLTSIIIPSSVTNIGGFGQVYCIEGSTFSYCDELARIEFHSLIPPIINKYTFDNVDMTNCILYVPAESVDVYKAAEGWTDFKIEAIQSAGYR